MTVFSGTSYLGLDKNAAFLDLVKAGVDRWGANYGGSRRSPSCPEIFREVEAAIADWAGSPAALLVGSGTAAGQLVARYLAEQSLPLQISPMAHPALWWPRGQKHDNWPEFLRIAESTPTVAFTDALNPLSISLPPWREILATEISCLVVDDSHLIGCYGPQHAGSWQSLHGRVKGELIITASLGKALALPAGIILGEAATLAKISALPQFGGASPPPPAFLHAWLHGQAIITEQRARLARHLHRLYPFVLETAGIKTRQDFPVFGLSDHAWGTRLAQQGILISAFRYPDARSPMYSRIVIRADHRVAEIENLMQAIRQLAQ